MGVPAGADGPTGIHRWSVLKKELLLQTLDLPHGLPSKDVIRRVLSALKVDAFQSCIVSWLQSLPEAAKKAAGMSDDEMTHMAIDGKTMRRSHDRAKGLGALHLVMKNKMKNKDRHCDFCPHCSCAIVSCGIVSWR